MLQMFSVIPNKFLPNSKNPCWYEEYRGNTTTDPYATNSYALYSKRFRTIFDYLRKVFWNHLYHYKDKHYRLRCLPRFYIIGQPKCGTTDLYDRLRLHPDVRFSAIKEPHWWTRKRFGELTCPLVFRQIVAIKLRHFLYIRGMIFMDSLRIRLSRNYWSK